MDDDCNENLAQGIIEDRIRSRLLRLDLDSEKTLELLRSPKDITNEVCKLKQDSEAFDIESITLTGVSKEAAVLETEN